MDFLVDHFMPKATVAPWLVVLGGTLIWAIVGALVPEIYRSFNNRRPHNLQKMLCILLARHQLAYAVYFLTVALKAEFTPPYVGQILGTAAVPAALGLYLVCVAVTLNQDEWINHSCVDHNCQLRLGRPFWMKVFLVNAVSTLVLLCAAWGATNAHIS